MGLDTEATLFYGITDNEEDHDALNEDEWWEKQGLPDPLPSIELEIAGSYASPVPFIYSGLTVQRADGDSSTIIKLDPFPPPEDPPRSPNDGSWSEPTEVEWLYKAADKLGWPPPDWHLAVTLKRG